MDTRYWTPEQLTAVLEAAGPGSRDHAAILLAYRHGLRASEVAGITPEHFQDGFLVLQRLKHSKRTTQRVQPELWAVMEPLIAQASAGQRVFGYTSRWAFYRAVQKHAAAAGIPAPMRRPHALKHSLAI